MGISLFIVGGVMGSYGTYLPNGLNENLSVRIQGRFAIESSHEVADTTTSHWISSVYCHRVCIYSRPHIFFDPSTHRLGLRCRDLVLRNKSNRHVSRVNRQLVTTPPFSLHLPPNTSPQALQFRNRSFPPVRLPKYILETLHHLRCSLFRCCSSSFRLLS